MNKLDNAMRARVVAALVEGNSIRAISRMTDVARNTVSKLLVDLGVVCSEYLNKHLVNLSCQRVQCDEIWSFVAAKQKNVTPELRARNPYAGDVWTWVAMDADTKLVCSWWVGSRDWFTAKSFVDDLAGRLANRVQLTTDGNRMYLFAINQAFHGDIDYGILMKKYGGSSGADQKENRYSPAECVGCEKKPTIGTPDPAHISTSYIERQNLTMRMSMRRFTRLTNAFSKKIENHIASLAIHYMHYNYCRIHQTLRITPAMAAGISDHVWSIDEVISLIC
jgi:IS1 family transposase